MPDPLEYDYARPSRNCDVVMKGGITSGVVYPHAVCELAKTYRFRNVGGTSAGAIAAAATAAAERGRRSGSFRKLAALPGWIGKGTNLQDLFQPQRGTRKVMAVLLTSIGRGKLAAFARAIFLHPVTAAAGAAFGVWLAVLGWGAGGALHYLAVAGGVLLAVSGMAIAVGIRLGWAVNRRVPDNFYGLCSGMPGGGRRGKDPEALTPWLYELLQRYAGPLPNGAPLTFGHLWAGPTRKRPPKDLTARHVQLQMMTTNLTHHTAHQLPWTTRGWYFAPDEFRKLFPEEVVQWMKDHPAQPGPEADQTARERSRLTRALFATRNGATTEEGRSELPNLLPMPAPEDLPVIVATRMSLSFPVLLSAVPLWTIDWKRKGNDTARDQWTDWLKNAGSGTNLAYRRSDWPADQPTAELLAERCWFSDGGIASNFPVQFFDRPLPRWPTFAIDLRPFPLGFSPSNNQRDNTWMADRNGDGTQANWYRESSRPGTLRAWRDRRLVGFLGSALKTMQNRIDDSLLGIPGYRDRVAQVWMSKGDGGMNLTMEKKQVLDLAERGRSAAERLTEAYTRPAVGKQINWDNHRWLRLRASLASLDEVHANLTDDFFSSRGFEGERTYEELVKRGKAPPTSYPLSAAGSALALRHVAAIQDLADASERSKASLDENAPQPAPKFRLVPRES